MTNEVPEMTSLFNIVEQPDQDPSQRRQKIFFCINLIIGEVREFNSADMS